MLINLKPEQQQDFDTYGRLLPPLLSAKLTPTDGRLLMHNAFMHLLRELTKISVETSAVDPTEVEILDCAARHCSWLAAGVEPPWDRRRTKRL